MWSSNLRLEQYLVDFWIWTEISGLLKKNQLEKLVSPVKRSAQLHASTKQNFDWRCFFELNGISIIFSREIEIKSILIHKYQHGSTRVNTNQHKSARINTSLTRINTSPTWVNTNQHESKTSLDHKKIEQIWLNKIQT